MKLNLRRFVPTLPRGASAILCAVLANLLLMLDAHVSPAAACGRLGEEACETYGRPYFCAIGWNVGFLSCVSQIKGCSVGLEYDELAGRCRAATSGLAQITWQGNTSFLDGTTRVDHVSVATLDIVPEQVVTPSYGRVEDPCGGTAGPGLQPRYPHQVATINTWAGWYKTRLMINTNFFAFETGIQRENPYFGSCSDVEGWSVSKGVSYAPKDNLNHSLIFLNPAGVQRFSVKAKIIAPGEATPYEFYVLAAASGMRLLQAGQVPTFPNIHDPNSHVARTAIGLDQQTTRLIVVVVQPGKGKGGTTLTGLANYMKTLGAYEAINFDGGGSSQVRYDNGEGTVFSNVPSDFPNLRGFGVLSDRPVPAFMGFR